MPFCVLNAEIIPKSQSLNTKFKVVQNPLANLKNKLYFCWFELILYNFGPEFQTK
jgi:hypothetical protein